MEGNSLEKRVGALRFETAHWLADMDSLGAPVNEYITVSLDHWVPSSASACPVKVPTPMSAGNLSIPSSSRLSDCGDIDLLS